MRNVVADEMGAMTQRCSYQWYVIVILLGGGGAGVANAKNPGAGGEVFSELGGREYFQV